MKEAYIQFVTYYLPEKILDNAKIAIDHPEWSIEKIAQKTGINYRHICEESTCASDLAINAADLLFKQYGVEKSSIDYILLCTQSPDYFLPTTACLLQDKLGLSKKCGALDFNLGCSGYIYGLGLSKGLIISGQANNVLLITSETYSKYIHPQDKSNKTIFGDGAAATLISSNQIGNGLNGKIGEFQYGTDGSGAYNLIVKNGASRYPSKNGVDVFDADGNVRNDNNLYMDGKAIFNFTAFSVPPLVKETLIKNNTSNDEIDLSIFHQANEYMLNIVRTRCSIDPGKFYINLSDGGNTVSSTIPIALARAISEGRISPRNKILLAGFGVGLSMASTIITIH